MCEISQSPGAPTGGKKIFISIPLCSSVFLTSKMLWTQESVMPAGKAALHEVLLALVSAVLDKMLPRPLAEIKSVVSPILFSLT
jgi:hypothetical protein